MAALAGDCLLREYRLREAARRLGSPDDDALPVLTIALDCGYGSIGPFNRAFKARFGVTPTRYRNQRLDERGQGGQTRADLTEIRVANVVLLQILVGLAKRCVYDVARTQEDAVEERPQDAHHEQETLAIAALIDVPCAGDKPCQKRRQPSVAKIDLRQWGYGRGRGGRSGRGF